MIPVKNPGTDLMKIGCGLMIVGIVVIPIIGVVLMALFMLIGSL